MSDGLDVRTLGQTWAARAVKPLVRQVEARDLWPGVVGECCGSGEGRLLLNPRWVVQGGATCGASVDFVEGERLVVIEGRVFLFGCLVGAAGFAGGLFGPGG